VAIAIARNARCGDREGGIGKMVRARKRGGECQVDASLPFTPYGP
jgi:hypothetical protein